MNVQSLRTKPIWIASSEVVPSRLDPEYYDPALTIAEKHLRSDCKLKWKRFRDIVSEPIYSFGAYELTSHITFVPPGTGTVPFLTVTEIENPFIAMERARHIDRRSHELLSKSACQPGTLLLSMAGSIGRVAVVPSSSGPCNSNQDVAKAIVDKDVSDPYFLSAYFTSSVGIAACEREAAGAVQKHLYLYNIEQLPVPDPSCQVRLAIGNKLRVAENLRSRVRALTESAASGCRKPDRR